MKPTDEQLRDLAWWPSEAEYYCPINDWFIKNSQERSFYYWSRDGGEYGYIYPATAYEHPITLVKRPTSQPTDKPEWDGEGKPPVNTECEMADENGEFRRVLTFAVFNAYVFGWDYERGVPYYSDDDREFRPLKTQAEIEREELACLLGENMGLSHDFYAGADAILARYELKERNQ